MHPYEPRFTRDQPEPDEQPSPYGFTRPTTSTPSATDFFRSSAAPVTITPEANGQATNRPKIFSYGRELKPNPNMPSEPERTEDGDRLDAYAPEKRQENMVYLRPTISEILADLGLRMLEVAIREAALEFARFFTRRRFKKPD